MYLWSFPLDATPREELALDKASFDKGSLELSGIAMLDGEWLIVTDDDKDPYVYEAKIKQKKFFNTKKKIDLSKAIVGLGDGNHLDIEGIATCGQTIYLADERVRQVIRINADQSIERLPIDFSSYPEIMGGDSNAGLEGIAADCGGERLYLAKEREPRFIITVDMKDWKILSVKDFDPSDRSGQKAINFVTGEGLIDVGPDVTELFFEGGFLYALERNSYELAKLDPKTLQVISRVSFFKTLKDTYTTGEPFGLAEALYLTKDHIIIGVDNNNQPLSVIAEKLFDVKGSHGGLFFFKRPASF
jgi:hypothetical protein